MLSSASRILGLLLAGVLATACGAEIGDSCTTNVECDPLGGRICDTSQQEGYCTVEGCDIATCPEEAVCIRFYPSAFLSVPCNPLTEDAAEPPGGKSTNDCSADEICLDGGYCVLRSQETRFCMKSCEADDDCREGYECRSTGTRGAEAVPDPANPGIGRSRFCGQRL